MIIGEHSSGSAHQQQSLLHIIRQDLELLLLTGQLIHLRVDLRLQAGNLARQRLQLRILLQSRFGIKPQLFQFHCDPLGHLVADEIQRRDQHSPDKDAQRQQLQYEAEIILRREQQRVNQQAQQQGHPHGDQQFAEQRFFHSVASVVSE